jgi:mannose-1-phosphate guanylyltransferase
MRHSVILAGGGGTRLWPASRRSCPKQFLSLGLGDETLLSATARRLAPQGGDRLYVVTAAEQAEQVRQALPALASDAVISEPSARNTTAALGLAAIHLLHRDPDAVMAAIPSDQHIGDEDEFRRVVDLAFSAAEEQDAIITVGIVPTRPETGYGYLRVGDAVAGEILQIEAFVEKPDAKRAQEYLESGNYLWNGGMFFTKASRLLEEIRTHMPEIATGLQTIADALSQDDAQAVCERVYPTLPAISIDYGVMERTSQVMTIRGDFAWNDVGSWAALADYCPADESGNVVLGTAVTHEASGNILVSDGGSIVAVAGVEDLVVVQSGNAVLVLPRERAQDVRALVDAMRAGKLDEYL